MDKAVQHRMQVNSDQVSAAPNKGDQNMRYTVTKSSQATIGNVGNNDLSALGTKRPNQEQAVRYMPMNAIQSHKPIAVPSGWNRILEKGAITYISPNKSRLRSMGDIKLYLTSSETCKCGLKCPLRAEETFSFNPNVPSVAQIKQDSSTKGCGRCHISSAFEKLLPHFSQEQIAKLLKKSSKKKKKKSNLSSEDELKQKMKYQKLDNQMPRQNYTTVANIRTANQVSNLPPSASESLNQIPSFNQISAYSQVKTPMEGLQRGRQGIQLSDHADYSTNYKGEIKQAKIGSQPGLFNMALKHGNKAIHGIESTHAVNLIRPAASTSIKSKQSDKNSLKKPKQPRKEKQRNELMTVSSRQRQNLDNPINTSSYTKNATILSSHQTALSKNHCRQSSSTGTQLKSVSAVREGQISISPRASTLGIMTSKAPPNITLPASHSNMLPTALTQSIRTSARDPPTTSSDDAYLGLSPGSSNSGSSPTELEQCKPAPEPDPFSNYKVKANVYWGSKDSSENVKISPEINALDSGSGQKISDVTASTSYQNIDHLQQYVSNGIMNETLTTSLIGISTESSTKGNSSMSSSLQSIPTSIPYSLPTGSMASIATQGSLDPKSVSSAVSPVVDRTHAVVRNPDTKMSPDKDSKQSPCSDSNQRQIASSTALVSSGSTAQGTQMVLFQFVSQSGNAIPTGQTSVAPSQVSGSSIRGQSVAGFQNVYGISNAQNMLRGASTPYQSGIAANNPAQFLIMGSQASQALQHLALQSNALESSMHHTENPHAMYFQNIPGYPTNSLKSGQQNIGFTYTPVQFMTIGDTQAIGKQPQTHPAGMESYQPIYQYYQGNRPVEPGKFDPSKPGSTNAATFVYPGIHQFAPGMPNNYVRIAPATTMARPPLPVPRFPLVPDALKTDHVCNGPSLSHNTTSTSPSVKTTSPEPKVVGKIHSSELTEIAKINETLKQESLGNSNNSQSLIQNDIENKIGIAQSQNTSLSSEIKENSNSPLNIRPDDSADRIQRISNPNQTAVSSDSALNHKENIMNYNNDNKSPPQLSYSEGKTKSPEDSQGQLPNTETSKPDLDDQEELSLQCHEDCNAPSEESRTPTPETANQNTPERNLEFRNAHVSVNCGLKNSNHLRIGDLIWGHQKGYSAWPGKVVSEKQIGESPADNGKVWVKWFGEHTHSQIELNQLKILSEGLKDLENSSRRRKNRASKKISESLEKALLEALQEVNESYQDYHVYKDYMENIRGDLAHPSKKLKS